MTLIHYDVTDVPYRPVSRIRRAKRKARRPAAEPGSWAARVEEKDVNLVATVEEGIPELEYLPGGDGMIVRGARHQLSAYQKTGKSIGGLVLWHDMVLAGCRVAVLDRENGRRTYAERLAGIMDAREHTPKSKKTLGENLHYYEFPQLRIDDAANLAGWATGQRLDLVVFDSQRMFLTDVGLSEDSADDYARFMARIIDPLFNAGVATMILDNTGHGDRTRARSTSSKGDLNEILFTLEIDTEFSLGNAGRLRLRLEPGRSRYGHTGEWLLEIGGGIFGHWQPLGEGQGKRDVFMDAARDVLRAHPAGLSQSALLKAIRASGRSFRNEDSRQLLAELVEKDPAVVVDAAGRYRMAKP
jgi:hypothetical protein